MEFRKDLQAILEDLNAQKLKTEQENDDTVTNVEVKVTADVEENLEQVEIETNETHASQESQSDDQSAESKDAQANADSSKNKEEYLHLFAILSVPTTNLSNRIKALKKIVKSSAVTVGIVLLLAICGGITYAILRACGLFG
ncbi:MAG: hypothetical protein HDT32_05065 [Clostridiales bacterium]|nr:hypothetical protein [Clostridiales bacterium]